MKLQIGAYPGNAATVFGVQDSASLTSSQGMPMLPSLWTTVRITELQIPDTWEAGVLPGSRGGGVLRTEGGRWEVSGLSRACVLGPRDGPSSWTWQEVWGSLWAPARGPCNPHVPEGRRAESSEFTQIIQF